VSQREAAPAQAGDYSENVKLFFSRAPRVRQVKKEKSTPELFSGFIKVHVLHHASEQPVYGLWLIEELEEHGYHVSPGTLYPLLHSLEETGMLTSHNEVSAGKIRRYYKITANGRRLLKSAKDQLAELMREILTPEELQKVISRGITAGKP
jgi:PadR family transcriptional regulator PadR